MGTIRQPRSTGVLGGWHADWLPQAFFSRGNRLNTVSLPPQHFRTGAWRYFPWPISRPFFSSIVFLDPPRSQPTSARDDKFPATESDDWARRSGASHPRYRWRVSRGVCQNKPDPFSRRAKGHATLRRTSARVADSRRELHARRLSKFEPEPLKREQVQQLRRSYTRTIGKVHPPVGGTSQVPTTCLPSSSKRFFFNWFRGVPTFH